MANEEFAKEVKRLYKEEEFREQNMKEKQSESDVLMKKLKQDLENIRADLHFEKQTFEETRENLLQSVKTLTFENNRLIKEKEDLDLNLDRCQKVNIVYMNRNYENLQFQDKNEEFKVKINKLEATIYCLRSEIDLENELKQDLNAQIEHLSEELAAIQNDLSLLRENNAKSLKHLKEKHSFQIKSEERKNEKLTQENFQVTLENVCRQDRIAFTQSFSKNISYFQERLTSKFKILAESQKKLELECNQLKVENQWLVNDKKKQSLNQSRFDEFAGEIEELNSQLKNEREKVNILIIQKLYQRFSGKKSFRLEISVS